MTELEIAKALGKQVSDGKPLTCPNCGQWEPSQPDIQPLMSIGDFENTLFCPHCDLTVDLRVTL